jgi:O-antigen ligase
VTPDLNHRRPDTASSAGEKRFSPSLRLGLLALATAGLLVAAFLVWRSMQAAGAAYPGTPRQVPPALDHPLGVNVDLAQVRGGSLARTLAQVEASGFAWVRQPFPWAEIEPQPGQFDWATWDKIVEAVSQRGLRLIAVLDDAPPWAQPDPAHPQPGAPPHQMADFGRFARAFARRYGDAIDFYQIWDEPNLRVGWGGGHVNPAAYVRLLREGALQIRQVDATAAVLLAGLAPTVEDGPLNLNEPAFLEGVYAAGGAAFFDLVAAKPYGFWHRADHPQIDVRALNFSRVQLLRRVMEAHGDAAKPLWAVAFGWNALPADWSGRPSAWGTDTESVQASDTVAAIERARREWPWLNLMILSQWQPNVAPDDPFLGFALLDRDGRARPVLQAAKDLASQPPVAWPGRYRPDHPSARYTGTWRVTPGGADVPFDAAGEPARARLEIPFYGTRLDLTVRRGDFWGLLSVTVDGQPANRLPRDGEGRAYLALYDPLHQTETVTLAAGLPDGFHQATIVPDGGWGQWAIAGWTVGREPDLWPYRAALWALGAASVACLALTAISFYRRRAALRELCRRLGARYAAVPEALQLTLLVGVAATFYFAPGLLSSLAALATLALLAFLRPDHGLILVGFAIPFFLRSKVLLGKSFSPVEVGTLLCLGAWLARQALGGGEPLIRRARRALRGLRAADWAVAALVALGALSLTWAQNFGVAAREFRVVVLESALFYGLLRRQPPQTHRRVADALVAGAAVAALIALWQYVVSGDVITAEGVRRVRALYGSPNNLALFLERIVPLAAALALWGGGRARRTAHALALPLLLAALLLTFSKGALLVGLPASLLFLGLMRGRRAVGLALLALAVLAAALLPFAGTERFASTFDLAGGTAFFRVKLWQSSLNLIADHPLIGVGLDNFLYAYRTRYVLPDASAELNLSHPHNVLLDFWVRLGLGGAVVLVWLVAAFFRAGRRAYRRLSDGVDRALVLGLLGGMVAALAHGLIDNAFFLVDLAFWFMLGLAIVQSLETEEFDA